MSAKGDAFESAFNAILGKVKKVSTAFSKKGYKQYMDSVARKNIPLKYQTRIAKQAAKTGMSKSQASAIAADVSRLLREAKKDVTKKMTGSKGTQGTLTRFKTKATTTEPAAGRVNARTGGDDTVAYQQEYGKGGKEKITEGRKSFPTMSEALSFGSKKRAKLVTDLEALETAGTITKSQKTMLDRLNALSKKADESRVTKASITRSTEARKKARGEADKKADPFDPDSMKISRNTERVSAKDVYIGNTTNGIKPDGDIIGNPTPNQIKTSMRDFDARNAIASKAKLKREIMAFIKRNRGPNATPAMRKAAREMEKYYNQLQGRKNPTARTTAKTKEMEKIRARAKSPEAVAARNKEAQASFNRSMSGGVRQNNRGGLQRKGHTDMRKGGLFYR
jgi:hypothetical protein